VLEDKIVQGAVAEVLSAVYEADFLGFSYGFRPGRSPHGALKALERALITRKINWVLDADIRSFFENDARRMRSELRERFGKFGLKLHEEKTRLIEFGRYAAERRAKRGERRPETFDFLGFTHCSSRTKDGRFIVRRKTQRKRMVRKLKELRIEAKRRRHWLMGKQQKWLAAVLRGHYADYGLPGNFRVLSLFAYEVRKLWFRALCRRSQKSSMTWERFNKLLSVFLLPRPTTRPLHDWLA